MMTEDALLWRLKYLVALVAVFMMTSFARPAVSDCSPTAGPSAEYVQR